MGFGLVGWGLFCCVLVVLGFGFRGLVGGFVLVCFGFVVLGLVFC